MHARQFLFRGKAGQKKAVKDIVERLLKIKKPREDGERGGERKEDTGKRRTWNVNPPLHWTVWWVCITTTRRVPFVFIHLRSSVSCALFTDSSTGFPFFQPKETRGCFPRELLDTDQLLCSLDSYRWLYIPRHADV